MAKNKILIEKINYFGCEQTGSQDWNAKVIYYRNNKIFHAMIYVDYFNKDIYINKKIQTKECKVYSGLLNSLNYNEMVKLRLI